MFPFVSLSLFLILFFSLTFSLSLSLSPSMKAQYIAQWKDDQKQTHRDKTRAEMQSLAAAAWLSSAERSNMYAARKLVQKDV